MSMKEMTPDRRREILVKLAASIGCDIQELVEILRAIAIEAMTDENKSREEARWNAMPDEEKYYFLRGQMMG